MSTTKEITSTETSTMMSTTQTETAEETTQITTETTTKITKTELYISESELEMLAHLIYGEAGNQGDKCQRAVGTVVMNRVAHKYFPNSIKGVIFDEGQYACTWDGNYDKNPSKQAYENAQWVLAGNRQLSEDYVYQAGFKQGYNCVQIGSEWFGTCSP